MIAVFHIKFISSILKIYDLPYLNTYKLMSSLGSVSFATEVEKNRPSHGRFNRGLRSTKDSKKATRHFSPPTNSVRDLKSLLLSWKACILVHLNG